MTTATFTEAGIIPERYAESSDPGSVHRRALFPRSRRYHAGPGPGGVREPGATGDPFPYSERHLQCAWYDPSLRPDKLHTREGEPVAVLHPGRWNLEAGPDFLEAELAIGDAGRRLSGDVEIHIRPSGWKEHGHHRDPAYRNVVAHVTYYAGASEADATHIALQSALRSDPAFSFDAIDLTAYPYGIDPKSPGLPVAALRELPPDRKRDLLDAAGEERLRRKACRMERTIRDKGPEQALWEEILAGLGYKRNKAACRRLAMAAPLGAVREAARGDPERAYAILLGTAGLLPSHLPPACDAATRTYLRQLWDAWWKEEGGWIREKVVAPEWTLAGLRPANHPHRRLYAAALYAVRRPAYSTTVERLAERGPKELLKGAAAFLEGVGSPYWSHRYSFQARRTRRPVEIVGASRASAMIVNGVVPYLAARGVARPFARGLLDALPKEPANEVIRTTAHLLFGPDHPSSLYATALRRQGLIQIFQDFFIDQNPDRQKKFTEWVAIWT